MSTGLLRILLADDDLEDLELIEDSIKLIEPSAILHKEYNGKAVLDYLARISDKELPCLIVLDYNMPELKGSEVLAELCVQPRFTEIPKVILSTSSSWIYIKECMDNGATEYMVKPTNWNDMENLSKKLLSYCS